MKTQEQIQERIDWANKRLTELNSRLSQENGKMFPNKETIKLIRELMNEENAAIVNLSWVLI